MCLLAPAAAHEAPEGETVQLGTSLEDAPEVTPGVYDLELLDSTEAGYLTVPREIDRSTIWLAETVLAQEPVDASYWVTPSADGEGSDCGTGGNIESYYTKHDFVSGVLRTEDACNKSKQVTYIHRGWDDRMPEADAKLAVWEEPPVKDRSILPPPALKQTWAGDEPVAKGSSELGSDFASAPEMVGGRWNVHVDPGKTALFKVPLDWNQHLQVGLTYDGVETQRNARVTPMLITPLGGFSRWGEAQDGPGVEAPNFGDIDSKYPSIDGGVVSPSITWRNREAPGVTAAFPGDYYVLLRLAKDEVPKKGMDVTVATQVITDKPAQSPYSQDADPIPSLTGAEEEVSDDKESAASSPSEESTPWGAVSGLFGGSAVMAVVGFVALARHRRSRA